jgi:hypothetical protein
MIVFGLLCQIYGYKILWHKTENIDSRYNTYDSFGRDIVQEVSRRLPTAAARVQFEVNSCGICGGQSGAGADLLRVLRFPLLFLTLSTAPYSSIIRGCYSRPIVADVPSGFSLAPRDKTKKKI